MWLFNILSSIFPSSQDHRRKFIISKPVDPNVDAASDYQVYGDPYRKPQENENPIWNHKRFEKTLDNMVERLQKEDDCQAWFISDITVDEASEKLKNAPPGAFLVVKEQKVTKSRIIAEMVKAQSDRMLVYRKGRSIKVRKISMFFTSFGTRYYRMEGLDYKFENVSRLIELCLEERRREIGVRLNDNWNHN